MDSSPELLISADSHVIEPHDLWAERLPRSLRDKAPHYAAHSAFQTHDGGANPKTRVKEMAMDGVSGEVLYASLAMNQFGLTDAALQEACFRIYNDWLIEYCSHAPDRLFGVGLVSTYRIENAIEEVKRCKDAGMRGIMIWQVPPEELAFATRHYERLWATCEELQMPVSLHILTGMPYGPSLGETSSDVVERLSWVVNMKLLHMSTALLHIIASGVLERFPGLKIVLVETEVSWLPYVIAQWDRYLLKRNKHAGQMAMPPSEYFKRQVYATFFNDPPVRMLFSEWGTDNCMWSNDFPHGNSTWPKSREVIARDLGHLPAASRTKLVRDNVMRLYDLPVLTAVSS